MRPDETQVIHMQGWRSVRALKAANHPWTRGRPNPHDAGARIVSAVDGTFVGWLVDEVHANQVILDHNMGEQNKRFGISYREAFRLAIAAASALFLCLAASGVVHWLNGDRYGLATIAVGILFGGGFMIGAAIKFRNQE